MILSGVFHSPSVACLFPTKTGALGTYAQPLVASARPTRALGSLLRASGAFMPYLVGGAGAAGRTCWLSHKRLLALTSSPGLLVSASGRSALLRLPSALARAPPGC